MRLAFVVRLGNESRPADGFFEGWVEEVDSYVELRFRSTDELLKFLSDRFEVSTATGKQDEATTGARSTGKKEKRIARTVRRVQDSEK